MSNVNKFTKPRFIILTQHTSRLYIQGYHRNVVETKESFWRSWAAWTKVVLWQFGGLRVLPRSESDDTTLEVAETRLNENTHGHLGSTSPWVGGATFGVGRGYSSSYQSIISVQTRKVL